jgi:hypothetical protein
MRRSLAFGRVSGRSANGFGRWSRAWGFGLVRRVVQGERGNAFLKEEGKKTKGNHFSFLLCCMSRGGRKRNSVVQNDTVPFSFFFFFFT